MTRALLRAFIFAMLSAFWYVVIAFVMSVSCAGKSRADDARPTLPAPAFEGRDELPAPGFPPPKVNRVYRPESVPGVVAITREVPAKGWHVHTCPSGHKWSHQASSFGNANDHTCPQCGARENWYPTATNTRIERTYVPKLTYDELAVIVKRSGSVPVYVAVGVKTEADYYVESVPETESGVWRCWVQADGTPMMQRR
jgi:hypothetical protein